MAGSLGLVAQEADPEPQSQLTIDEMLESARASLVRCSPEQLEDAMVRGALVVDIRTEAQRREQGPLHGAKVIDLTVLQWRLDPRSPWRIAEASDHDLEIVLVCSEGYCSSLAAVSLQRLGLRRATDLEGGFKAWAASRPESSSPDRSTSLRRPSEPLSRARLTHMGKRRRSSAHHEEIR
jgi:rhodanese-related sulfurtransferase